MMFDSHYCIGFLSRQKYSSCVYLQGINYFTKHRKQGRCDSCEKRAILDIDNRGKVSFLEFLWIAMELLQSNIILQTLIEVTLKHNISCKNITFEKTCVPFKHFNWKIVTALKFLSYKLSIFKVYSKTFYYFLNSSF